MCPHPDTSLAHLRADICVLACAEAWRGDGEILASPIGVLPTIAALLAKATFAPDLVLADDDAVCRAGVWPVSKIIEEVRQAPEQAAIREGWLPLRTVFDTVWSGRRHVMMGAAQIDQFGNQNISCIGEWSRPQVQLVGARGAPGNTVNHPVSYWVPNHSRRTFVRRVDFVSGVGYDRAAAAGPAASRFHEIRRVVTDLAVLDFATPDRRMRLVSRHPGVTLDAVVAATDFPLVIPEVVPETPTPAPQQLSLLADVIDPRALRYQEVRS